MTKREEIKSQLAQAISDKCDALDRESRVRGNVSAYPRTTEGIRAWDNEVRKAERDWENADAAVRFLTACLAELDAEAAQ
jgi:hypothetical protein